MKFLLIVLAVRFVIELISNKGNNNKESEAKTQNVFHPAEYELREGFYRIEWGY